MSSECQDLLTLVISGSDQTQIINICYQYQDISNGTTDCKQILTDSRSNYLDSGGNSPECQQLLNLDFTQGTDDMEVNDCTNLPNYN